jgi:hypothetical protein
MKDRRSNERLVDRRLISGEECPMTGEPALHGIEIHVTSPGYDNETILVEAEVEAHGLRGAAAAVAIVAASAGGAFLANSGSALAPEPARLNSTLTSSFTPVYVTYIYTNTSGTARFMSSSWTYSTIPAGTPCVDFYPVPAGYVTSRVVIANGNYRKCY